MSLLPGEWIQLMHTREHNRLSLYLTLLVAVLFAGCARLPEYARPQFATTEERVVAGSNSFGYRQLKVSDFKASSLPESLAQFNHRIQARSCISIRPADDTVIRIVNGTVSGQPLYIGNFSRFTYQADFNPDCSWWSGDVPKETIPYVLQHEQIHFALAELTARKLNRESREELEQYPAFGRNPQQVQAELVEMAKRISREAMEQEIDQHTSFDEETSLYYDPEVQQKWYDKVSRRLAATRGE